MNSINSSHSRGKKGWNEESPDPISDVKSSIKEASLLKGYRSLKFLCLEHWFRKRRIHENRNFDG